MSHNKLLYTGNEFEMDTDPLFQYYNCSQFVNSQKKGFKQLLDISPIKNKKNKEFLEQQQRFCSLGYSVRGHRPTFHYGTWEIKDNKLYLVDFYGYNADREKVGMEYLYPNQKEVFVEWFTGEICVPKGENHYFHNSNNFTNRSTDISEENIYFNFIDGFLISRNIVDNKKSIADEYRRRVNENSHISFGPNIEMYPEDFRSLYENAINFYIKLLDFFPLYAEAYLYMGEANYAKKDFDQAICNYKKAIEIEPSLSEAHDKLALIYSSEENLKYYDLDSAIIIYQRSLEINPTQYDVFNKLGNLFVSKGEFDEAIFSFENAIKHDNMLHGNSENQSSQFDRHFYPELYMYKNNLMKAYKKKSNALIEKKIIDSSLDILSKRIVKTYIILGDIYSDQGDFDDAINYYQKSIEFVRTPEMKDDDLTGVLIETYKTLINFKDYEKALFYCEEALELFSENNEDFQKKILDIYTHIGDDYSNQEKYTQAFDYYKKAIDLGLEYSNKYIGLSNSYFKNNDYLNAISHKLKAGNINIDIIYTYRLFYLGSTLYKVGNYNDAISPLKVVTKICTKYVEMYNRILKTRGIYNNSQIESDLIKNFIENKDTIQHESTMCYLLLGNIYVKQKKYVKAIYNYYSAIKIRYSSLDKTYKSTIENRTMQYCFYIANVASLLSLKNVKTKGSV